MSRFPAAFRLPAFASRSSHSRQGIGSPHGRPTDPHRAGPRRGYRVPHARAATGVGAPYTPRTVVLTPQAKARLVDRVHQQAEPFKAMPVRRVYIPKRGSSTKRRPLGIPVIVDRCHQARVVNALEPEWEARFEPRSYGFRPGRGCHDAIQAVFEVAKGKRPKRLWVLDADLAGAFDRIGHDHILAMLGSFPARGMIQQWLKAGVVEQGRLHRTEEGTPQGGVVSPVLLNIALHGMEQAVGVRYLSRVRSGWTPRL